MSDAHAIIIFILLIVISLSSVISIAHHRSFIILIPCPFKTMHNHSKCTPSTPSAPRAATPHHHRSSLITHNRSCSSPCRLNRLHKPFHDTSATSPVLPSLPSPPSHHQVRRNLHTVFCMSPVGSSLRIRCRKFPALINTTVIDWFHPWPAEALISVASRFLEGVKARVPLLPPLSPIPCPRSPFPMPPRPSTLHPPQATVNSPPVLAPPPPRPLHPHPTSPPFPVRVSDAHYSLFLCAPPPSSFLSPPIFRSPPPSYLPLSPASLLTPCPSLSPALSFLPLSELAPMVRCRRR